MASLTNNPPIEEQGKFPVPQDGEVWYVRSTGGSSWLFVARKGKHITSRYISLALEYFEIHSDLDEASYVCPNSNVKELAISNIATLNMLLFIKKLRWDDVNKKLITI